MSAPKFGLYRADYVNALLHAIHTIAAITVDDSISDDEIIAGVQGICGDVLRAFPPSQRGEP